MPQNKHDDDNGIPIKFVTVEVVRMVKCSDLEYILKLDPTRHSTSQVRMQPGR
jgi:hypothetical protein